MGGHVRVKVRQRIWQANKGYGKKKFLLKSKMLEAEVEICKTLIGPLITYALEARAINLTIFFLRGRHRPKQCMLVKHPCRAKRPT